MATETRSTGGPSPAERVMAQAAGAERPTLEAFLDYYRDVVTRKISGVSDWSLRRRWVGSQTTLGGLVKHLAVVERTWFGQVLEPEATSEPGIDGPPRSGFELDAGDSAEALLQDYALACRDSRTKAGMFRITDTVTHPELGAVSLRWIYLHVIDETARHAGHLDILRELTDGSTGT